MTTVKDLIDQLTKLDPDMQVMVGTQYDNETELTEDVVVQATPVNHLEGEFYSGTVDDGEQDKNVIAIW